MQHILLFAIGAYSSCKDARYDSITDGEYQITLGGTEVSVYCYKMRTENPKAYITLPEGNKAQWVGPKENEDGNITASEPLTTVFHKIRIDEATLKINTGDFTWAETEQDSLRDQFCGDFPGPSCTDDKVAVPFGLAGNCPFYLKQYNETVQNWLAPASSIATMSINLTGTGLKVAAKSSSYISQYVHALDLAKVMQPPNDWTENSNSLFFGPDANTTAPNEASLTGTVEYGVREDAGDSFNAATDALDYTFASTSQPGTPRPVGLFCDYLINYGWVSDIPTASNTGAVAGVIVTVNTNFLFYLNWPKKFRPVDALTLSERLLNVTSGGYGICLCPDGQTCEGVCTWESTGGYEVNYYTEETSPTC